MGLGIYALVDASLHYRRELRRLEAPRYTYEVRGSSGIVVALILAVIGALGFVGILVQALLHARS